MIHSLQRADVVAVEDDFAFEFVPVLLDVVVLDHNDDHIDLVEEAVEVENLVLDNLPVGEEGVEALERAGEVTLLDVEHLEGRALADVVHVLLVGEAIEAHAAVVGDAVLLHDLVDALQHEHRLAVVGLHRLVDHLGQLRVVAHQEPGIHADAVAADAGPRLQDVHARVHVADLDDLVHVHVVVAADAGELVREGDVDGAEGVLDDLGHLGRADVGDDDLALAEGGVVFLYLFAHRAAVGTDRAVVVQEFIDHVAGDNALRGVDEVDVLADLETVRLDHRADVAVNRARADRGLDHDGRALRADFHHVLDGRHHVAGVHFLAEFVVGGRDGDDVGVRLLVFRGELDARLHGGVEQLVQAILLEGGPAGVQGRYEFLVVVGSDDFHTVGSHHQSSRQADIAQANNVDHMGGLF